MEKISLEQELKSNSYPGRGIVIGRSADGTKAVAAYFIMGRSENSRNRIFVEEGLGIRTQAFDPSKLVDPSLIIYAPVRVLGNKTIVTNGDQTDTIYEGMDHQLTFEQSLRSREFEPDAPNYTPRISAAVSYTHLDVYKRQVLATGKTDLITDGKQMIFVKNGTPMLTTVTGTGCMLGALCASYLTAGKGLYGAAAACGVLGICGELAETGKGSGSFMVSLMDHLSTMSREELERNLDMEVKEIAGV